MRRLIFTFFILTITCAAFKQTDIDLINAYALTIGKSHLFEQLDKFIGANELPTKMKVGKTDFQIKTKDDIINAIKTAKGNVIVTLSYPGIEMWYTDGYVIPFSIDFRQTSQKILYEDSVAFDKNYSFKLFENLFPNSSKQKSSSQMSFFHTVTNESGQQFKHFFVERESKDDPTRRFPIEFTFENDKLIFICFFNVG